MSATKAPKRKDAEYEFAKIRRKAGWTKEAHMNDRREQIEKAAKLGGWRPSERAATIANAQMIADDVWTDIIYKFKRVPGSPNDERVAQREGHSFRAVRGVYGWDIERDAVRVTVVPEVNYMSAVASLNLWLNTPRALTDRLS